jgi:hypothetical protein
MVKRTWRLYEIFLFDDDNEQVVTSEICMGSMCQKHLLVVQVVLKQCPNF